MFERYTDRARKVMQLANQEAKCWGRGFICVGDIFVGLLREGNGCAAIALKSLGLDLEQLLFRAGGSGLFVALKFGAQLPFAATADTVLRLAEEEAAMLGVPCVGTEHLLLALAHKDADCSNPGVRMLQSVGIDTAKLREHVLNLLGQLPTKGPAEPIADCSAPTPEAAQGTQEAAPAFDLTLPEKAQVLMNRAAARLAEELKALGIPHGSVTIHATAKE